MKFEIWDDMPEELTPPAVLRLWLSGGHARLSVVDKDGYTVRDGVILELTPSGRLDLFQLSGDLGFKLDNTHHIKQVGE